MYLTFLLTEDSFTLENPSDARDATSVSYIRCHFTFNDPAWQDRDGVIIAVFKSASFDVFQEVLLDANGDCFIDPDVYKHGGVIQVKLYIDRYFNGVLKSNVNASRTLEFLLNQNLIVPTEAPSNLDILIAEFARMLQDININQLEALANGFATGLTLGAGTSDEATMQASDMKQILSESREVIVNVTSEDNVTFVGDKTYSELVDILDSGNFNISVHFSGTYGHDRYDFVESDANHIYFTHALMYRDPDLNDDVLVFNGFVLNDQDVWTHTNRFIFPDSNE